MNWESDKKGVSAYKDQKASSEALLLQFTFSFVKISRFQILLHFFSIYNFTTTEISKQL